MQRMHGKGQPDESKICTTTIPKIKKYIKVGSPHWTSTILKNNAIFTGKVYLKLFSVSLIYPTHDVSFFIFPQKKF